MASFLIHKKLTSDNVLIANHFNNYFKTVFSTDDGIRPFSCNSSSPASIGDIDISEAGALNLLLRNLPEYTPGAIGNADGKRKGRFRNVL